jgi:AcrR family transcriptional regulator
MTKGTATRQRIVDQAVALTRVAGLEALSIGHLADLTGMSKAGLFRHFGSKTSLQQAVLEASVDEFRAHVIVPALRAPSGLARLTRLLDSWLDWTKAANCAGGCPLLGASIELDDRPGKLRDYLVDKQRAWLDCIRAAAARAVADGDLRADLDVEQFAFEFNSIGLGFNFAHRLLGDVGAAARARAALERLVATNAPGPPRSA